MSFTPPSSGGSLEIKDEGVTIAAAATSLDFTGTGVTATAIGSDVTADIPGGGGSGTVTSVSATVPTGLTVSGVPITTSGTIAIALDTGYVIPTSATLAGFVTTDQTVGQTIGATGARLTKLWATDITVTNAISGSVTGNAGTVTGATFTTALTVNTGTVTLTGNVANTSVLTIGAGAVSVSGSNTGDQTITLTGDVTGSGTGSFAATIANSAVTLAKMANMATASFIGRNTAGTGVPEVLSATTATAILNAMVGDSGSGGTKGLVPAPASGDAAAGKFLKADGTWAAAGGSFSWGASASGTTADGVALTLSNTSDDGAAALKLIAGNTQSNQPVLANLQLGTSANVMGLLIQGTGSTTAGAAGTGKNHLTLWGDTASNTNKVLSVGNGTSFGETGYLKANGQFALYGDGAKVIVDTAALATTGNAFETSNAFGAANVNWNGRFILGLITQSSATLTARTNPMVAVSLSRTSTATSGTVADNYNFASFVRTNIQNGAGGTFTAAGSVGYFENVATQTVGVLTDSVIVLKAIQDVDSTGDIFQAITGSTVNVKMPNLGGLVVGAAAIATNATNGFLYIPTCAGTPSGTPVTQTGTAPIVWDSTNKKLYVYDGSWLGGTVPGAFV